MRVAACKGLLPTFETTKIPTIGVCMQKVLIGIGIAAILAGLLWPWLGKIPLGRLPGDLVVDKPGLKVYVPLTSMILASLLVTLLLWIFKK